jgi:hypothetical protein
MTDETHRNGEPTADGGGGDGGEAFTRSGLLALEKAVREGRFEFTEVTTRGAPKAMENIVAHSRYARNRVAAAKVLVAMKMANVAIERNESGSQVNVHVSGTVGLDARRSRIGQLCTAALERAGAGGTGESDNGRADDPGPA